MAYFLLIALGCAGVVYGGRGLVHGVKRAGQAVVHVVHHKSKPKAQ